MFIRYFVELTLSFEDAERALLRSPASMFSDLADGAQARGDALLADVGFTVKGHRIAKRVAVTVKEPVRYRTKTALLISWKPAGGEALFPTLEGDLEVAPLGSRGTHLAISASYEPPGGGIGLAADRAILHRVAEATVKDFLDRVADAVMAAAA